ncbi:MAG: phage major capsid protein [Candidatus Limnocylindrus sp.]
MSDYIKRQHDLRQAAWHEAKHLLEEAAKENRDLNAEEQEKYDRISGELDSRAAIIEQLKADEERAARLDAVAAEIRTDEEPAGDDSDAEAIRSLARGEIRSHTFEKRDVLTSSTGSPVPTGFYDSVILKARLVGPMLDVPTIMATQSGEAIQVPSLSAYSSSSTVTAQGANFSEADPTFNSFVNLSSHKYGFLIQVSREMIEDSGVDLLGFLADQVGNGLGYNVQNALTNGTGTVQPQGIVPAAGSGVTGGTGVTGAFTADNLIDLYYSLDGAARLLPGVGWMMNGASIGAVRKLKDDAGQYIFQPSLDGNSRDLLVGRPVYENPHMANAGTAVKSVICGHFPSFMVRTVGGIRLDRSDEFAFNADLVTFRASMRVDGALPQSSHVKYFIGGTA